MLSKFESLIKLEVYKLPHPNWVFVSSIQDIPEYAWTTAPDGWSIRSCPKKTYTFSLPSRHKLDYSQLKTTLEEIRQSTSIDCFVIYPSWNFYLSGGLLSLQDRMRIEVVYGDIALLLRGLKSPDFIYENYSPTIGSLKLIYGDKDILNNHEKKLFYQTYKLINVPSSVIEWTITSNRKLIFHDYVET